METNTKKTGQANTVLIIPDSDQQLGTITKIHVDAVEIQGNECKITNSKSSGFDEQIIEHYHQELLPIIDRICLGCKVPCCNFKLSVKNLQAASINNIMLDVNGYSADISVFVAMLSAILDLPLSDNMLFSGHISKETILPVASLPVKLQTAIQDGIKNFYCADLDVEDSLALLDKDQLNEADNAIRRHRRELKIVQPSDIFELFDNVFSESDILLSSIKMETFSKGLGVVPQNPADKIAQKICSMDMHKFRVNALKLTNAQDFERLYQLWNQLFKYHLDIKKYPSGCGKLLYEYMCQIPPHIRKSGNIKNPFVPMGLFIELCQIASPEDYEDLGFLFDGIRCKYLKQKRANIAEAEESSDCSLFDSVASLITSEQLNKKYGIIIDQARACFVLPASTVDTYEELIETIESYYCHLCSYTSLSPVIGSSPDEQANRVYRLIDRAFAAKGGFDEVRCRGIDGSEKGLISVLDEITEQFKRDIYSDHVEAAFKRAIDISNDQDKKAFVAGALQRLRPLLPPELRNKRPEYMTDKTKMLAQIYTNAIDAVRHNFSRV